MTKRILIDGLNLSLEKGTGVATYARNLSHQIKSLGRDLTVVYGNPAPPSRAPLIREISFFDSPSSETLTKAQMASIAGRALMSPLGYKATRVPISGQVIRRQFEAQMPAFDDICNAPDLFKAATVAFRLWGNLSNVTPDTKPDLTHWTYPLPIRVKGVPNIYTLHDIVPLRLPYTTLDNKNHYYRLIKKIAKTADHIITVSEHSKKDLVEIIGIEPNRISNTYQCAEIPKYLLDKSMDQVAREISGAANIEVGNYFIFWGSIEPKKNVARIIEAYMASGITSPLVIVGAQAWKSEKEVKLLKNVNQKGIIHLSYVPFSLLVSLIRGAKAALFPSLYEGFGLPALEAMQLGTPVICSNTSSLPEVVGDAAVMVDPYDTAAISKAIRDLEHDLGLRDHLSAQGLIQAQRFSADAYRTKLNEIYSRFGG